MSKERTIAAIATAVATSGIGIIRISGDQAIVIAEQIFKAKNKKSLSDQKSHTIHYGWIFDENEVIDEVLIMLMKGPHSYTTEDTIEINCHGGILILKKILELVIRSGADLAQPGEFTKRAFLNGRIDLSQAEAVIDLINSKNNHAMKSSIRQLKGSISEKIKIMRESILYHVAYIESALDDPEHISLNEYGVELDPKLNQLISEIEELIKSSDKGKIISEGVNTAIVGRPNVGKSSLLNLLLGEERAIVTDVAGTTRDTLEEQLCLDGINLNIIDTAGIHDTEDIVEQIGIAKAKSAVEEADLVIMMIDASLKIGQDDLNIFEIVREKRVIVLLNKSDLTCQVSKTEVEFLLDCPIIEFSAKNKIGIDQLENTIKNIFYQGEIDFNDQIFITNIRHKNLLESTLISLNMVKESICNRVSEDFYSIDLMDAYEKLGCIIGASVEEDLVNKIFSSFCTGK